MDEYTVCICFTCFKNVFDNVFSVFLEMIAVMYSVCWRDCHKVLHEHSWSPEDESSNATMRLTFMVKCPNSY